MELSIPVVQIAVVGIITFGAAIILKPLALVIRDYMLWAGISRYMEKTKFDTRAQRVANLKAQYREKTSRGNLHVQFGEEDRFFLGETAINFEQFKREQQARESLRERIYDKSRRVNKELSVIGSLLRHFDQQEINPALDKIKYYERREFARKGLEIK